MFPALNKARNFHSNSSDQQISKRDMRKHQDGASGAGSGSGVGLSSASFYWIVLLADNKMLSLPLDLCL